MNTSKFMNRLFRRIHGVVWDVLSGSTGLQTENGIYSVTFAEDGTPTLSANPIDSMGLSLPAFATQTAHADVNVGDIIVGDQGIIGWVTGKTDAAFKVLDHNGMSKTYNPPRVAIMGTAGVLVVRNLMTLTGGAAGAGNFAANLLPLLALGGGDDKLEKLLPLLLMTSAAPAGAAGAAPAAGGMNALLPLLLLKDGGLGGAGGKLDPMTLLMLSGGLGGGAGGMNPMLMMALMGDGDLFGGSTKSAPALSPVTRGGVPTLNRL